MDAHSPFDRMHAIIRTGRIYEEGEYAKIVSASLVTAPDHVQRAFDWPGTSLQVIKRDRIVYQDDEEVSRSTSWIDGSVAEACPLLLSTERIPQGTLGYIAERTQRFMERGMDTFWVKSIPLNLDEPQPYQGRTVLKGCNWVYDEDGNVIEYGEFLIPEGRKITYKYHLSEKRTSTAQPKVFDRSAMVDDLD